MRYFVEVDDREIGLEVLHTEAGTIIRPIDDGLETAQIPVDFAAVHSNVETGEGLYSIIAGGKSYQLYVEPLEHGFRMAVLRHRYDLNVLTEREWRLKKVAPRQALHSGAITINAPMPGLVKEVLVAAGDSVSSGQRLLVLEAMKMENDILASAAGKVTQVTVQAGTVVDGGKALVTIEA
ncbi:MAG: biotin/lipoyl-containing protein [Chloroflexota bacterium]